MRGRAVKQGGTGDSVPQLSRGVGQDPDPVPLADEQRGPEAAPIPEQDSEKGPERTCIVTRRKGAPEEFIRFVISPDKAVVPDLRRKLPGRGAWVTGDKRTIAEAVKRKSFARAFKAQVEVDPGLADLVDGLLEKDALQALAMANKAGLVVAGATKIEGSVGPKVPAALVHASDGSPDGTRKLEASVRRRIGDAAGVITRIRIFRSDQLDLALGRTNVIHAAVAGGTAGDVFVSRSRRLDRYRGSPLAQAADLARPSED